MKELNLPPVERVVAYCPRPGDTIVLTLRPGAKVTPTDAERLKQQAQQFFGSGIKVLVLGPAVDFAGVVGPRTDDDKFHYEPAEAS